MVHSLVSIAVTVVMLTLTRGIRTPERMEQAILTAVPAGSDIAKAKRYLDSQGFRRGFGFGAGSNRSGDAISVHASRFIIGFREDRLRPLGTMKWTVTIFHRAGIVTAVQA
ncbi:MAG TPA: hypothetical protein VGH33_13565, partial [Isosphaeraceae bacterium]